MDEEKLSVYECPFCGYAAKGTLDAVDLARKDHEGHCAELQRAMTTASSTENVTMTRLPEGLVVLREPERGDW